jgi:hypothetical protein
MGVGVQPSRQEVPRRREAAPAGSAITAGALDPGRLVQRKIALEEADAELAAMAEIAHRGITVVTRF